MVSRDEENHMTDTELVDCLTALGWYILNKYHVGGETDVLIAEPAVRGSALQDSGPLPRWQKAKLALAKEQWALLEPKIPMVSLEWLRQAAETAVGR